MADRSSDSRVVDREDSDDENARQRRNGRQEVAGLIREIQRHGRARRLESRVRATPISTPTSARSTSCAGCSRTRPDAQRVRAGLGGIEPRVGSPTSDVGQPETGPATTPLRANASVADARYPTPALRSLVVAAAALILAAPATASEIFAVDAQDLTLQVNGSTALVSYTAKGNRRNLLVWGAINALPSGSQSPQTSFRRDYSGGWKSRGRAVWSRFVDRCRPYTGSPLPFHCGVHGAGRDALGCAGVAATPADAWLRPMEAKSGGDGIPSVALVWPGRVA